MTLSKIKKLFAVCILLYLLVYYAWTLSTSGTPLLLEAHAISWLGPIVAGSVLYAIYFKLSGKDRFFWLLFSLGCFSYAIAEGILFYARHIAHTDISYPGLADLFYAFQVALYLSAFALQLWQKKENSYQIKFLFDMAIMVAVFTALSWHFLMQHLIAGEAVSPLQLAVSIGYPIGDLLLLFGAISFYIGSAHFFSHRVLILIAAGLIVQIFAGTAYLHSTIIDSSSSGVLYDPLWSFGLLLMALAGLQALEEAQSRSKNPVTEAALPADEPISLRLLLPYFSLVLLFIVMVFEQQEDMTGLIAGLGVSVFLVIIRQVFTLQDNRKLLVSYHQLTSGLEQGTDEEKK